MRENMASEKGNEYDYFAQGLPDAWYHILQFVHTNDIMSMSQSHDLFDSLLSYRKMNEIILPKFLERQQLTKSQFLKMRQTSMAMKTLVDPYIVVEKWMQDALTFSPLSPLDMEQFTRQFSKRCKQQYPFHFIKLCMPGGPRDMEVCRTFLSAVGLWLSKLVIAVGINLSAPRIVDVHGLFQFIPNVKCLELEVSSVRANHRMIVQENGLNPPLKYLDQLKMTTKSHSLFRRESHVQALTNFVNFVLSNYGANIKTLTLDPFLIRDVPKSVNVGNVERLNVVEKQADFESEKRAFEGLGKLDFASISSVELDFIRGVSISDQWLEFMKGIEKKVQSFYISGLIFTGNLLLVPLNLKFKVLSVGTKSFDLKWGADIFPGLEVLKLKETPGCCKLRQLFSLFKSLKEIKY